jgi:transmembrane sensor
MEAAMEWLLRLHGEESSDLDVSAWLAWYESDAKNREIFDAMRDFWRESGRLTELGAKTRKRLPELAAIPRQTMDSGNSSTVSDRISRSESRLDIRRRRSLTVPAPLRAAAAGMAVVLALWLGIRSLGQVAIPWIAQPTAGVSVPTVRHTRLPDGSEVDLAPNSEMAVQFTASERAIALERGEAFFTVAPNRTRPFIVNAVGVRVRAVGTEFNVRQGAGRVTVTVAEGTVDIDADRVPTAADQPAALRLSAGNEFVWDQSTGRHAVRATRSERALAWRSGRLEYIDEPLDAVITDVNRYSARHIVIQDPRIGRLTYTGTVFIGMVDEWLAALPSAFPIRLVSGSDSVAIASPTGAAQSQAAHAVP